jgi:glycosyltransferase involved in cell wall biosynthesis
VTTIVVPDSSAPRVSIVMAVFNGEPYIRAALRSVLDQDFRDFELIVVDDGSSDRTAEIVRGAGDRRVIYHRNERNLGQTPSLNVGLRLARGEFVARLDADDEYLPGKLSAQVAFLDATPGAALCGTWAECIDEQGSPSGIFRAPTDEKDVLFRLVWTSPLCHVSVLMRREAVAEVGGYDEAYRYAADYRLWSELAMRGHRLVNLPVQLMRYRVFAGSFGGASVLGDAGWESARIISENARRFCDLDVSLDDARAIHLRAHPGWGGEAERLTSYRVLRRIASAIYGRAPMRARWDLFAALVWTISQAPASGPRARPTSLSERLGVFLGRTLRHVSPARIASIKAAVSRLVRPVAH